ncbi:N-terminal L-serine N(alpha)-acetyltransferase NatD PWA37_003451 [Arxiozyma heterogenica]|uniref:N-alpha-acetyltransferase 40 n=1 Tax=Arxiozyma heterogenica TaxID=278026 RepID=A0AAN7ZYA8_9SACH|nr:hypothetical protein RI543_001921 [Kazachstania heterogenica]
MSHLDNINTFISKLKLFFPETIEYEEKDRDIGVKRLLRRHTMYIDDSKTITTINKDGDSIQPYSTSLDAVNNKTNVEILKKFLNILDINLGKIYKEVSHQIYNNQKSWEVNKWEEMLSPGLIYVSYWRTDTDRDKSTDLQPVLFLSFMLTEEIDVSRIGAIEFVVYLYEIQILPELRGLGIGQRLLGCLKDTSMGYNNCDGNSKSVFKNDTIISAIVLTVFSENEVAIRFYKKLQFRYTVGSPRDELIDRIANRTRKRQSTANSVTNQHVIKPIYYLLHLPL